MDRYIVILYKHSPATVLKQWQVIWTWRFRGLNTLSLRLNWFLSLCFPFRFNLFPSLDLFQFLTLRQTQANKHTQSLMKQLSWSYTSSPSIWPIEKRIEYAHGGWVGEKVAFAAFTTFCFKNDYRFLVKAAFIRHFSLSCTNSLLWMCYFFPCGIACLYPSYWLL